MNKRKIINLAAWALLMLMLVFVIYREYKHNLRTCQITFQSEVSPEADGLERIIVSNIEGVQRAYCEGFEYEADRNRYVLDMRKLVPGQPCFLNLESAVWNDSHFLLEYRLKNQDASAHESDGTVITRYDSLGNELEREAVPLDAFINYKHLCDNTYTFNIPVLSAIVSVALLLAVLWVSRKNIFRVLLSVVIVGICIKKYMFYLMVPMLMGGVAAILVLAVVNLIKMRGSHAKVCLRDITVSGGFFTFTAVFFIPAQLILGNSSDFGLPFWKGLLPTLVLYCAISMGILYVISLSISDERLRSCFSWLVYFTAIGIYVQINFLNPDFPTLDGADINFSIYGVRNNVSTIFWAVLIVIYLLLCLSVYKQFLTDRIKKYGAYLAGALCIMQFASLAVMVVNYRIESSLFQNFTCDGEYELAAKDNALLFVVDTLSEDAFSEWLDNSPKAGTLEDFVVYDNYITTGSPTCYSIPMLLSGMEFSHADDLSAVREEIYAEDNSLSRLKNYGMDIKVYSDAESVCGDITGIADNVYISQGRRIQDAAAFGRELYKLVCFVACPMRFKPVFMTYTDKLTNLIKPEDGYRISNISTHERLISSGLSVGDYDRAFRMYHLRGVHLPYENDAMLRNPGKTEQECLEGVMLHIRDYIDGLKELGLYDSSMIVIMGDHGRHNDRDFSKANPALAIKYPGGGSGSAEADHTPVISRNILATVASVLDEDYTCFGPAISDLDMDSYGVRFHTVNKPVLKTIDTDEPCRLSNGQGARFILEGNAHDGTLTCREWNPYIDNLFAFSTDKTSVSIDNFPKGTEYSFVVDISDTKADQLKIQIPDILGERQEIILRVNGRTAAREVIEASSLASAPAVITSELPKNTDEPVLCELIFPNACTPNQLDRSNPDRVVKSVKIDSVAIE